MDIKLFGIEKSVQVVHGEIKCNLSELKNYVNGVKERYDNLVLDETQKKEGKELRAELNKLEKSISSFRKKTVDEFKSPIVEFEKELKELEKNIGGTSEFIDSQIKKMEEQEKEQKRFKISEIIELLKEENEAPNFTAIFNEKWLNSTFKDKDIESELLHQITEYKNNLKISQEREKLLQEKKEFLAELIEEKNSIYNLKDKILYTDLEYALELPLSEIKLVVVETFETRKKNQIAFEEKKETKTIEKLKVRTIKFEITKEQAENMIKFFNENKIKYEVLNES